MSKLQINQLFKTVLIFVVGLICGTILFSEQNPKFDVFLSSNNSMKNSNNNQIEEVLVSVSENSQQNCTSVDLSNDLLNISGLKLNETGFGFNIVPNIVHYVLFNVTEIQFGHFISFLSVLKNQKPEKVYIHLRLQSIEWRLLSKSSESRQQNKYFDNHPNSRKADTNIR